jgi:hypothetical protein
MSYVSNDCAIQVVPGTAYQVNMIPCVLLVCRTHEHSSALQETAPTILSIP